MARSTAKSQARAAGALARKPVRESASAPVAPKITVKKSSIHGSGVFAEEAIARGRWIGRYEGVPAQRDGRYVLWLYHDDGSEIGIRGTTDLRFLNHSARANAEFRDDQIFAIRNIAPGDEITCHYGDDWDDLD